MSAGKIKDPAAVTASADVMAMARANCAERLRDRGTEGEAREAENFERGDRDWSWAMKHEVAKLVTQGLPGAAK